MRPYEVMIIFDVELEQSNISQRVDRISELVKSRGGTPGHVDHWGRRTFAYELNHRSEGYYVLVEVAAEPETMSEIDRLLALDDSVLRHKVMRQPDHVAARSRSGAVRRSGSRGPSTPARAPHGPRSGASRGASVPPSGPRPSSLTGGNDAPTPPAEPIERAEPADAPAPSPATEVATS